jgi:hypothetical protein
MISPESSEALRKTAHVVVNLIENLPRGNRPGIVVPRAMQYLLHRHVRRRRKIPAAVAVQAV